MSETPEDYPFAISFIDPLFAVAIHLGLADGILEEPWAKSWQWPPTVDDWFHFATFGVGLLAIIVGWIGYHASLKTKPIRAPLRFVIDVMLVLIYAFILVQFRNIEAVLLLFTIVFVFYLLWDVIKVLEHSALFPKSLPWRKRYRREVVTGLWLAVFVLLNVFRMAWGWNRWVILSLVALSYLLYRYNKNHEIWAAIAASLRKGAIGR